MMAERPARPTIASFRELRGYVREDYAAHSAFWEPGFQAVLAYRLSLWCNGIRPWALRAPVRLLASFLMFVARNLYGIELSPRTRIGRRFTIAHQSGIVIHPRAVIGDDCLVRQGVTIGATGGSGEASRPPVLGDRVHVGAGAVLAGPITIGDDVTIGPNAVVMTSVPAGSIVAAPPARIVAPPPRRKPT
jgi:serine O-acetyltransferase